MTVLPIVGRELRVASRRYGTYWSRFGAALGALAVFLWMYAVTSRMPAAQIATNAFNAMAIITFIWAILCGLWNTSDSVSAERRDGTLGLLFLTDLRGYDVAAGKLVSHSLSTFYGLLATFPVMAIPILMGGVTWTQFGFVMLVLANTMFFSLSVGLLASTWSKKGQKAAGLAFVILALSCVLGPLVAHYIERKIGVVSEADVLWLLEANPVFGLSVLLDRNMMTKYGAEGVLRSSAYVHAFAWMAFIAAAVILPRIWQTKPRVNSKSNWKRILFMADLFEKRPEAGDRLTAHPATWLSLRLHTSARSVWMAFAIGAILVTWMYLENRSGGFFTALLFGTITFFSMVTFKVLFASTCVRQFSSDRQTGALELLLSTPLAERQVVREYGLALVRAFMPPFLTIMVVQLLLFAGAVEDSNSSDLKNISILWVVFIAVSVHDMFTMCWLGMWRGLTGLSAARATGMTNFLVLTVPWIGYVLAWTVFGLVMAVASRSPGMISRVLGDWMFEFGVFSWAAVSIAWNTLLARASRNMLIRDLRRLSTEPVGLKVARKRMAKNAAVSQPAASAS